MQIRIERVRDRLERLNKRKPEGLVTLNILLGQIYCHLIEPLASASVPTLAMLLIGRKMSEGQNPEILQHFCIFSRIRIRE